MSDGGATNLEAALAVVGSIAVVAVYGFIAHHFQLHRNARDAIIRDQAYRKGREDEREARLLFPDDDEDGEDALNLL